MIKEFSLSGSHQRRLWQAFKLIVLALLIYVIYSQVFLTYDTDALVDTFVEKYRSGNAYLLLLALLFMPVNWLLEMHKWRILVAHFQPLSSGLAWKAILTGVCLAIITPARLGEYGGRLTGIDKENISNALAANFISSTSQNIINVVLGVVALFLFNEAYEIFTLNIRQVGLTALAMVVLGIIVIYRYNSIKSYVRKLLSNRLNINIRLSSFTRAGVTKVMNFAFLRYLVYVLQYIILLYFYGVTEDLTGLVLGVAVIYLFQSMVPLPPVLSIFARGEVAIFVWGIFTTNLLGILAATFTLWTINLLIPALIGYIILWKQRPFLNYS